MLRYTTTHNTNAHNIHDNYKYIYTHLYLNLTCDKVCAHPEGVDLVSGPVERIYDLYIHTGIQTAIYETIEYISQWRIKYN